MRIVNGKRVEVLTGLQAKRAGYLPSVDALTTLMWDAEKLRSGAVTKIVYVNGVYTGTTRPAEKFADTCHRLKIVS